MMEIERRVFALDKIGVEMRGEGDKATPVIRGHAAIFDTLSDNLGGFREQIAPGAFDDVLSDDVRALFNHNPDHILGRSQAGTLRLSVDNTGLSYEVDPPDTQIGRDLVTSMRRGDINQSSFAFTVAPDGDSWDEDEDGRVVRTITKFKQLFDVSPVTYPAYPDATVGLRSLAAWREASKPKTVPIEILEAELRLAELL